MSTTAVAELDVQPVRSNALADGFARMGSAQKLKLGVGVLALLGVALAFFFMGRQPDWRVLYANLGDKDGGAIVAQQTGRSPLDGQRMALDFLETAARRRLSVLGPLQARQEALTLASVRAELGSARVIERPSGLVGPAGYGLAEAGLAGNATGASSRSAE